VENVFVRRYNSRIRFKELIYTLEFLKYKAYVSHQIVRENNWKLSLWN
jgi:hypothetical protein